VSFFLSSLCFKEGHLPQGAATSPTLSNLVARRLDARLKGFAAKKSLRYTRYADDIIFSGTTIERDTINVSSEIIADEGFSVNHAKTQLLGLDSKKIVTGISITNGKLALPRKSIRMIKQEAHFLLKYGYFSHMDVTGKRDPILIERLLGRTAFWLQVDPGNTTARRLHESIAEYRDTLDTEVKASLLSD
jgi:RNA-directed DNA polymerase